MRLSLALLTSGSLLIAGCGGGGEKSSSAAATPDPGEEKAWAGAT